MKYQLGQLVMVNSIIQDLDNGISRKYLTEQLKKRQSDLFEYCKAYEEEEFQQKLQQKLNGVKQDA